MRPSVALGALLCGGCPLDTFDVGSGAGPSGGEADDGADEVPTDGAPTGSGGSSSEGTGETTADHEGASSSGDGMMTGSTGEGTSTGGEGTTTTGSSGGSSSEEETGGEATDGAMDTGGGSTSSDGSSSEGGSSESGVVPTYTVRVDVAGLIEDSAEFTLNGGEALAVVEPGLYAFAAELPAGAPFAVEMTAGPVHYTCGLVGAVGVVPEDDVVVTSVCAPKPAAALVISEVGFGYYTNDSFWLEIGNVGGQAQSLAGVSVRAPAYQLGGDNEFVADAGVQEFTLPAVMLAPGAYVLVRGAIAGETAAGPGQVLLAKAGGIVPHWGAYGAIELRKAGASLDYVAWGSIPANKVAALAPAHPSAWPDYPAGLPAPPAIGEQARGKSLARAQALTDTNAAGDLAVLTFSTPAGPNDTHGCVADVDADGLPDCAESGPTKYAGVDLKAYGASPAKRDIFVEIDAMNPKGGDGVTVDAGMVPQKAALDRIVQQFAVNGIALHFDVGDLFDKSPGIDLANHDLGGGQTVPFHKRTCFEAEPGCDVLMHELKAAHFTLPRLKSFHYAAFVNLGRTDTVGGQGELPGNDLYVSTGSKGLKTATPTDVNILVNNQAVTLMHELGHNLGLGHGGYALYKGDAAADTANHKPNYLSIMNYVYSAGLPTIGNKEGDRYYWEHEDENPACVSKGVDFCTMTNSMCGPTAALRLDFSHGDGLPIDTAKVFESQGLRHPGSTGVDYDCDGTVEVINYASKLYAAVDGMNVPLTVLRDHDDWADLDLFFSERWAGFNNGEVYHPAERDAQPRAIADELPPGLLAWLRRR